MRTIHEPPDGVERRGETELEIIRTDIRYIQVSIDEIKESIKVIEQDNRDRCRTCQNAENTRDLSKRMSELERNTERMKGMAIGISAIIGALFTLLNIIFNNAGK